MATRCARRIISLEEEWAQIKRTSINRSLNLRAPSVLCSPVSRVKSVPLNRMTHCQNNLLLPKNAVSSCPRKQHSRNERMLRVKHNPIRILTEPPHSHSLPRERPRTRLTPPNKAHLRVPSSRSSQPRYIRRYVPRTYRAQHSCQIALMKDLFFTFDFAV